MLWQIHDNSFKRQYSKDHLVLSPVGLNVGTEHGFYEFRYDIEILTYDELISRIPISYFGTIGLNETYTFQWFDNVKTYKHWTSYCNFYYVFDSNKV